MLSRRRVNELLGGALTRYFITQRKLNARTRIESLLLTALRVNKKYATKFVALSNLFNLNL